MDFIELEDDLPKKMLSFMDHGEGEIDGVHDGDSKLLCICQQCNNSVETVNSALSEGGGIVHAITTHTVGI